MGLPPKEEKKNSEPGFVGLRGFVKREVLEGKRASVGVRSFGYCLPICTFK
jgi:hypothetical protein